MIYQFPKMIDEHAFLDLAFVASYSDRMVLQTGDRDWAVVYEFQDDDSVDNDEPDEPVGEPLAPRAVLLRFNGQWSRRPVKTSRFVNGKWVIEVVQLADHFNLRTYEVTKTAAGWKLTMYDDGLEVGGAVGAPGDCDFLLEQAEEFCGK